MLLGNWTADTESLASRLPAKKAVTARVNYLLGSILPRGHEVDASVFDERTKQAISVPENAFLVVDRPALSATRSAWGRKAKTLPGVAFVTHSSTLPSVLVLPTHQPGKVLGNGLILLHELEHVTEKDEGVAFPDSLGASERHAYGQNIDILTTLDGSDFNKFIDTWPVTFSTDGTECAAITFHDTDCPVPPRGTYAYDLWAENGTSRTILQSIGRMATLELVALGLPEMLVNQLSDTLQRSM